MIFLLIVTLNDVRVSVPCLSTFSSSRPLEQRGMEWRTPMMKNKRERERKQFTSSPHQRPIHTEAPAVT